MLDIIINNLVNFVFGIGCLTIGVGILLLLFKWDDKQDEKFRRMEQDSWRSNKQKNKSDDS